MQRQLLQVSQFVRQHFGIDESIRLLESIHNSNVDLSSLLNKFDLSEKQQAIKNILISICNVYLLAEIKSEYYSDPELKLVVAYKRMQESLMWINGQRRLCIAGMLRVKNNLVASIVINAEKRDTPFSNKQHALVVVESTSALVNTFANIMILLLLYNC